VPEEVDYYNSKEEGYDSEEEDDRWKDNRTPQSPMCEYASTDSSEPPFVNKPETKVAENMAVLPMPMADDDDSDGSKSFEVTSAHRPMKKQDSEEKSGGKRHRDDGEPGPSKKK